MRKNLAFVLAVLMLHGSVALHADIAAPNKIFQKDGSMTAYSAAGESTESPVETESPNPEESPAPPQTPEPTEEPVETEDPVETEAPVGTEEPEETEAPVETEEPAETPEPEETEAPVESRSPVDGEETPESGAPTTEPEETEDMEHNPEQQTEEVGDIRYNVTFPTGTSAHLDPGNVSGRGQIFSDRYTIENHGNTDVVIKIKNIQVFYRSTEDVYALSEEEITDHRSSVKKMNINMVWLNESEQAEKVLNIMEGTADEEVLTLRAAGYDGQGEYAGLQDGSAGVFYFTGTLNANPDILWEEGEITVRFDYEIFYAGEGEPADAGGIEGAADPGDESAPMDAGGIEGAADPEGKETPVDTAGTAGSISERLSR